MVINPSSSHPIKNNVRQSMLASPRPPQVAGYFFSINTGSSKGNGSVSPRRGST
jgi:hypothetical protein